MNKLLFHNVIQGEKLGPYSLLKKIGQGAFGTVYQAKNANGDYFAIKCPKDNAEYDVSLQEMELAKKISDHENVVKIFTFLGNSDKSRIYCVMEYCEEGDLNDYVLQEKANLAEKFGFFVDIARGVNYLHNQKVIHRDLKPQNILLARNEDGDLQCKITDFGISKSQTGSKRYFHTATGTIAFVCPEVLSMQPYTYSADVFALGLIFYCVSHTSVMADPSGEKFLAAVDNDGQPLNILILQNKLNKQTFVRVHFPGHEMLGKLVLRMLDADAQKRPVMTEVITVMSQVNGAFKASKAPTMFQVCLPYFFSFILFH